MSDYARPEDFFAEGDDYEGVHVLACARRYNRMSVSPWQGVDSGEGGTHCFCSNRTEYLKHDDPLDIILRRDIIISPLLPILALLLLCTLSLSLRLGLAGHDWWNFLFSTLDVTPPHRCSSAGACACYHQQEWASGSATSRYHTKAT